MTASCPSAGLNNTRQPVAIAIGSNLGDRHAHLAWAVDQLTKVLQELRCSSFIETAPVDVPEPQPPYLNGAVVGETDLPAETLLTYLLDLEKQRGRQRLSPRAPRTLDLDLILYGDLVMDEPGLTIPHPRFRERRFVLDPLSEIAPHWKDPETGKTIVELAGKGRPV